MTYGGRTPPQFRRYLNDQEFLESVARFEIDCRMSGGGVWFYNSHRATDKRNGWPVTPQQVIDHLNNTRFEGERALVIYASVGDESRLVVGYSDAGLRRQKARQVWKRFVGTPAGLDPTVPRRKPRKSRKRAAGV